MTLKNPTSEQALGESTDRNLIAYRIGDWPAMRLVPAPSRRDWMDQTPNRFANRCLPLLIANQSGWFVLNSHRVTATWSGGVDPSSTKLQWDGSDPQCPASSHFGSGIVTFCLPWLFRTPPGWNLLCRSPANLPKDGACALEGVIETDWTFATFTVNWQITRRDTPVTFEVDEPIAMLIPSRRGELEDFSAFEVPLHTDCDTSRGFMAWSGSRGQFLQQLKQPGTEAARQGWQKHYAQGLQPNGSPAPSHQTRLALRPFVSRDVQSLQHDLPPQNAQG